MRILRHAQIDVTMNVYTEVSDAKTLKALGGSGGIRPHLATHARGWPLPFRSQNRTPPRFSSKGRT
jgi:hypothetical protein